MTIAIRPLGPVLGAEIEGIDLRRMPSADTVERLHRAYRDHLLLCIRGQELASPDYVTAARLFGEPRVQLRAATRLPEEHRVSIVSSEDRDTLGDGRKIVNGAHWHTDDSFKAVPCSSTLLYGVEVPSSGGDTQFTNMYAAYDTLPDDVKQRIAGLRVVHQYSSRRKGTAVHVRTAEEMAETPDVDHPIVRTHPETGRKALYLNPNRMDAIVGMSQPESDALLDALITHATEERFQYRHRWRRGDLVVWDNRCTMHKANADYPEGERRLMHRIIVEGTVPV